MTGLSTEFLQAYEYAQNLVDVDLDTFTGSMQRLTDKMADARDSNEKLAATFEQLGVSIIDTSDGSLRPAEEVIMEVIDALHNMGNETERNAIASDLFGKSYQSLNPLIVSGTETLQGYMEAAKENYNLTENQISALGELDDQIQLNKNQWEGLKQQIAAQFAPASKEALENFSKLVGAAGNALVDSRIIEGTGEIFSYLSAMMQPLSELLDTADSAPGRLSPVYEVLHGIAGVIAWIADAGNTVLGILQGINVFGGLSGMKAGWERVGIAQGYGKSSGNYSNLQKWQGAVSGYVGNGGQNMAGYGYDASSGRYYDLETGNYYFGSFNAGGTDNWRGGLTWVGENGPELVSLPKGSQIHTAQESKQMTGVTNWYVTIDAKNVKEFNDIIRMAEMARILGRME